MVQCKDITQNALKNEERKSCLLEEVKVAIKEERASLAEKESKVNKEMNELASFKKEKEDQILEF